MTKGLCCLLLILGAIGAASAQAKPASLQFQLRDANGVEHRQTELAGKRAVVVFFSTIDCSLSNGYVPEMNRISKAYAARGVSVYGVETDTTLSAATVREHAREFEMAFPVLLDPHQYFVRLAGATTTPEVAVFSPAGALLYLGRVDNRVEDFGAARTVVTEHDLRDALDAVLSGKPVPQRVTKVVGCAITDLNP